MTSKMQVDPQTRKKQFLLRQQILYRNRKTKSEPEASIIHSQDVEIVDQYKYLGTGFDSQLKFDANTDTTVWTELF